jgi:dienelactone hydrolase
MTDVTIGTPNGQMPAYVATPAGAGPWPGVVVLHVFAGMSRDLRNQADHLRDRGKQPAARRGPKAIRPAAAAMNRSPGQTPTPS